MALPVGTVFGVSGAFARGKPSASGTVCKKAAAWKLFYIWKTNLFILYTAINNLPSERRPIDIQRTGPPIESAEIPGSENKFA
jgi:hypothetical protein